ncbi:DNA-3-methyladenine glycosylase-like [Neltuma alba]|uniref:DNA-3-methyladenine glycosylase-like n=1 Tax=Neltuma alba TaxID=207710 RepID=UPI0010A3156E|nr:DNA-3-methyladenine glycosylase-like [Prosopis alba]XP_028808667.1 DNA-3-methyladenine glycosylase-like [Prosopis alba]
MRRPMSVPKSIPAKVQGELPSTASVPDSLFDEYCFRGQRTPRTQPFKRAGKPSLAIPETEQDDGSRVETSRRSKSTTLRAKSKPQLQPQLRLNALPLSDTCFGKMKILPRDFFQIDALDLARRLLGKFLRRDDVVLQITEVEAYRPNDSACHGRFGITARTAPVFGPGGHAYVYLCYGLHIMLNVVADKEGAGAAVLIRSCAPVSGLAVIQQRRGQKTEKPVLLTGPGKVGQALGLSTEWSNHPLYRPGGLEVLDGPEPVSILVGPRVGIEYASPEHVSALWRFAIAGTPWISAPKNTLRPPS